MTLKILLKNILWKNTTQLGVPPEPETFHAAPALSYHSNPHCMLWSASKIQFPQVLSGSLTRQPSSIFSHKALHQALGYKDGEVLIIVLR